MFKGARKKDLQVLCSEIGELFSETATILDLNDIIKNSEKYKNDPTLITDIANGIIEERRSEEASIVQIEKLKLERFQTELKLAEIRKESSVSVGEFKCDKIESLDSYVKSVRILTVKIPTRAEDWGHFFVSLERAFETKKVPKEYQSEILLILLGDRANNILTYVQSDEITDYEKLKTIVLKQYEPTAQACLENFRKAFKQPNETHTQFAARLTTSWEYYIKMRKVKTFEELNQLIISDKLFSTLDRETSMHISIKKGEGWMLPIDMAQSCDVFFQSKAKPLVEVPNFKGARPNQRRENVRSFFSGAKTTVNKNFYCVLCKSEAHNLYRCPAYEKMCVPERLEIVKQNNACYNCLGQKHILRNCKSKFSCQVCGKRHHNSLHFENDLQGSERESDNCNRASRPPEGQNNYAEKRGLDVNAHVFTSERVPQTQSGSEIINCAASVENRSTTVLLSTAQVLIKNSFNNFVEVRVLLDNGSMSHFATQKCVEALGLTKSKTNLRVSCLGNVTLPLQGSVRATIANKEGTFIRDLEFLVVERITEIIPSSPINIQIEGMAHLRLADSSFNVPGEVDLLLGAPIFFELLKSGQIFPPKSELVFQNTVFGYVASGRVNVAKEAKLHCGLVREENLNLTLQKFWEIEEVEPQVNILKGKEHQICEDHFQKTHQRKDDGRYIVEMPFKEDPSTLGDSKAVALKRLDSLWNRLGKDAEYLNLYKNFLSEYEKLGHMREVKSGDEPEVTYFMPHHGVYRPEKTSTKLRVVFNGSTLTNKGNSLNSIQLNGGVIQKDLYDHMLNFRKYKYAFTADIQKMYRMIEIAQNQRKLQRILWRESANAPVKIYELNTVTYGTVSAPFLAMRTLQQIAVDEGPNFPLAEPIIRNNFYMDDVLAGAETLSEVDDLKHQLTCALQSAGMELHKWRSNCPSLQTSSDSDYAFSDNEEVKTLGVLWNCQRDTFVFKTDPQDGAITKRQVLSTIARIFDPLGLVGPVIAKAKMFLQSLWLLKIDWGDPLPEREVRDWSRFLTSLRTLVVEIPRSIFQPETVCIELHGFADASSKCFGAVVYAKTTTASSDILIRLVTSKSRCAPVKVVTIPRLELSAAVLLSKLMKRVQSTLNLHHSDVFLWSDSMIVLSWITKESSQLKTFVANRVATIQDLTSPHQWRHVPTHQNPADLVSRGLDPDKLSQNTLWFEGPEFLKTGDYPSKVIASPIQQDDLKNFNSELKNLDSKNIDCFHLTVNPFVDDLLKFCSKYVKLIRVLSFVHRFVYNCRRPTERRLGPLTTQEINHSETFIVKEVQRQEFRDELKQLSVNKNVLEKSKVKCLNPFLDKEGVIRVNGRLKNANINFNCKFPIILPKSHQLTKLIIDSYHKRYFHLGPTALLHYVRQRYWPVQGKATCRKVVHDCIKCFKVKPVGVEQLMGDLPKERVNPDYPFNCSGVDFCGPFLIRYKHQRKGTYHKIYVCIFVCLVTKAVHLEIVTDLTSEAFIACLKRFVARRGLCSKLFSDNGTNFVGASKELSKLFNLVVKPDDELATYLSTERMDWFFLPPKAPNFGGLWESCVKSFKYHFKRVLGNSNLTYEEFLTATIQIEGILNSRPLVPLSSDTDVYDVLTPAHFLIGRPLNVVVEPNLTEVKDNCLTNWRKLTKIIQTFWKKWQIQYLNNLQQRSKWMVEKDNVKINELVLLKDDNLPPQKWALGRIIKLYFGEDKRVRVVKVKTQFGIYKRPISKICILPMNT